MRKLYFVLLGLGLLLAGLVVAQAENPFEVEGKITAIDYTNETLVVNNTITVYATENTVVVFKKDETITYSFDDLYKELYVKIQADMGEIITAKKICVPIKQSQK